MRVLIFMTQFYQLGGAEKLAVELAVELNKRGIHADILSMYNENLPGVLNAKEELHRLGIPNVYFLGLNVHPTFFSIIRGIFKLRRLIQNEKINIIESSSIVPTIMAYWSTLQSRIHHIAGIHMAFDRKRDHGFLYRAWRINSLMFRKTRYYAISDYVAQAWLKFSGCRNAKIRTIYNAIPDVYFTSMRDKECFCRELNVGTDCKIVIFVGRLIRDKGIGTLLTAVGPILKEEKIQLVYIGLPDVDFPGTTALLQQMENIIKIEGWNLHVHFLGYRKDIPRLLASADVLVHPTRMEGFGLTLVEAMATGLPVVTTNVEAIPEVLTGTESLMVQPDDPIELRKAILKTLNRSNEESALATKKGKERSQKFRLHERVDSLVSLFNDH